MVLPGFTTPESHAGRRAASGTGVRLTTVPWWAANADGRRRDVPASDAHAAANLCGAAAGQCKLSCKSSLWWLPNCATMFAMDAETPKAAELSLPQAFLLLATNDKDGKPEVPVFALRTTVAGAILAELGLLGAIGLQGKHVRATGTAPQTDFQHELELIRGKSRPHTPRRWVSMLEGRAEVQRVYEGMASLGIVEHVGEKHLGRFRAVRYPEKDHAPEAALLKKIQAALSSAPSDPASRAKAPAAY